MHALTRSLRHTVTLAGFLAAPFALAQDGAADRAEMDLVAGRVLFQNSPLSDRIVEVRLPSPPTPSQRPESRRGGVRVVLPSPYAGR